MYFSQIRESSGTGSLEPSSISKGTLSSPKSRMSGLQSVGEKRQRSEELGRAGRERSAACCAHRQHPQPLPGNSTRRGWSCAYAEEPSCFIWIDAISSSEEAEIVCFTREATKGYCPHPPNCTTACESTAGLESGGNSLSHPKH